MNRTILLITIVCVLFILVYWFENSDAMKEKKIPRLRRPLQLYSDKSFSRVDIKPEHVRVDHGGPAPVVVPPSPPLPSITISTAGAPNIATKFSENMVDDSFKGQASNGNARDLQANPYLALTQAMNFTNIAYPSFGSAANYANPPSTGNNADGYGSTASDFTGSPDNFNTWHDGVNLITWGFSFAEACATFATSLSARCDICYNLKNGTNAEMDWWVANCNPEFIGLGCELINLWDKDSYATAAALAIAHLAGTGYTGEIVIDTVNVNISAPAKLAWNVKMATIAGAGHGRYHLQAGDRCAFGPDPDNNVALLTAYVETTLPADLATFKSRFLSWKMFISQLQMEDGDASPKYVDNTPQSNWGFGKIMEFIFANTTDISYAAIMKYKDLINNHDVASVNYDTLLRLSPLFGMQKVGTITFNNMPGVTGKVVFTGSRYLMLINNKTWNRYQVPVTSITINGIAAAGTANRDTGFGSSWISAVTKELSTEATIEIREFSNSVVELP